MQRSDYGERQAWRREYGGEHGRSYGEAGGDWSGGHGESWERPEDFGVGAYGEAAYGRGQGTYWQSGYGYSGAYRPFAERGPAGWGEAGRTPRGPYSGRGPRGYQRGDDRICEDVCEALSQHGEIDAGEIEVEVHDGEVTLSGTVADRWQKRAAEDALEEIGGVRDVHNRLRVQPRYWQEGGPAQPQQLATTGAAGNPGASTQVTAGGIPTTSLEAERTTSARSTARSR
jgi:hypothetical protein